MKVARLQQRQPRQNNSWQPPLQKRDQSQDAALRAKAELENFRRRSQKETGEMLKFAEIGFVRDLLPGLDNLRRALAAAEQTSDVNELLKGVNMVLDQLEGVLAVSSCEADCCQGGNI